MLDSEAKFWLAQTVTARNGSGDVTLTFTKAKKAAGKVSSGLIPDGASNFCARPQKASRGQEFLRKDPERHRHIRTSSLKSTKL